ncbi:MAG: 3-methyl-2-oxobutanoate hydroxymethyltransferase [Marinicaulis sp.]|nr:3-methyl-2-oxobutanoate hydroxymethyltransferase [Marinicaulis sp.]
MSSVNPIRKQTVSHIRARKGKAPIVCLTAYDALMTEILDPHVDLLLVGDSAGTVLHGAETTIPVTLDEMILHGRSVMRADPKSLVVIDLPFGSYEASPQQAFDTASRVLKETGADAVKLEGGVTQAETINFLTERGVPVMAHVGLRPQAVRATGGYKIVGKTDVECEAMRADIDAVTEAGAFCVVLEGVIENLARELTARIEIPTIGIGASPACDGQILVTHDMLGLLEKTPKFVRLFANLRETIGDAIGAYAEAVRDGSFPAAEETYGGGKSADVKPINSSPQQRNYQ